MGDLSKTLLEPLCLLGSLFEEGRSSKGQDLMREAKKGGNPAEKFFRGRL